MDVFSLQCFLMLKDQLNFTRAANAMNVSQPTLSRIIAGLEKDVGVLLFNRCKQGITVTAAGHEFASCAEKIVQGCEQAVRRTRAAAAGHIGTLSVSYLPAMGVLVSPAIRRMKREHPEIILTVTPQGREDIVSALNDGKLDLGIVMDYRLDQLVNCHKEQFYQDNYYVALHCDHPLAKMETVRLHDLADDTCLLYKAPDAFRARNTADNGAVAKQFEAAAKIPLYNAKCVDDLLGLLTLLDCQEGIAILPIHLRPICPSSIKFISLSLDAPYQGIVFHGMSCWSRSNSNPALDKFLDILRTPAVFQS